MMNGPPVLQFGTVISAFHLVNACMVCSSASMCPFTINTAMQSTSLTWHSLFFGRVRMFLSLAIRVLVMNIFMFTLLSHPNRHVFMSHVLPQEIERKVLRFLTPIRWTKLGMFSATGALYGSQLFLQDLRLSSVVCVLSTHEAWIDSRRGTISALGRWRRRHTFLPNPAISWKVAFDLSGILSKTTHSEILSEAGHRRP